MRVYTHGKKKGSIDLLVSEQRLLHNALSLLDDIHAHGNPEVMTAATKASSYIAEVLHELNVKKEVVA